MHLLLFHHIVCYTMYDLHKSYVYVCFSLQNYSPDTSCSSDGEEVQYIMDNKKLFVGNLPWTVTSDSLREMFAEFGEIVEAMLITDRETGRSKGFGFVTFTTEEAAQAAISAKNNSDLEGRPMVVNVAKPKEPRNDFRGGGGGGYRGGGGGGGYRGGGGGGGGSRY